VTRTEPLASGLPTARFVKEKLVYDRPYPNGNSGAMPVASYHRYPTLSPSEYWTWLFAPGHCAGVCAGTSARLRGNVTGSLPDGLTSPNSTSAMALPSSWPLYQASRTPPALSTHGMVTAEPVCSTTTVRGFAPATAEMRSFCVPGRAMSARSPPSPLELLANTTATSAFRAAATAAPNGLLPGGDQPRLTDAFPPFW